MRRGPQSYHYPTGPREPYAGLNVGIVGFIELIARARSYDGHSKRCGRGRTFQQVGKISVLFVGSPSNW